ncbi:hypothetical protein GCM10011594_12370 [Nakamurella endophytica]|uniref:Uncharacterized protein n=1 Tax=Nakamurella endophytica TaxID=1748367 RepID=A0A917WD20_9ACTN|nr:hypothetical protein GCM10011594_12370 [Nakamurella endophytica]
MPSPVPVRADPVPATRAAAASGRARDEGTYHPWRPGLLRGVSADPACLPCRMKVYRHRSVRSCGRRRVAVSDLAADRRCPVPHRTGRHRRPGRGDEVDPAGTGPDPA